MSAVAQVKGPFALENNLREGYPLYAHSDSINSMFDGVAMQGRYSGELHVATKYTLFAACRC